MTDFEILFRSKRDYVFRYLMKLTRDPHLAEELTQEAFFRAFMNYSGLRNQDLACAWLCQIARNTYFAWYNEQKKLASMEESSSAAEIEDPESLMIHRELSDRALACLQELEEPYREVFTLSVFGGFALKDISSIFGKSESWARVTFYRARQKLMEKMR